MGEVSKKPTLEELSGRVNKLKEFTEFSLAQVKDLAEKRPVETTTMSFAVGIVIGVIIGAVMTKR